MPHITKIAFANESPSQGVDLAIPVDGRGAINVFCGRNNSGKSFLLSKIDMLLSLDVGLPSDDGHHFRKFLSEKTYEIETDTRGRIESLFPESYIIRELFGAIGTSEGMTAWGMPFQGKEISVFGTLAVVYYALLSVDNLLDGDIKSTLDSLDMFATKLRSSKPFVEKVSKVFHDNGAIYPNGKYPSVFPILEKYLGSPIGVSPFEELDAHLCFRNRSNHIPFDDWSSGLKQLACLESSLASKKFDVVLLDEIETHFHRKHPL